MEIKSKKPLWIGLIALSLIWLMSSVNSRYASVDEALFGRSRKGGGSEVIHQPPAPAPDPVSYGNFLIKAGETLEEVEVPAGYSLEVGLEDNVAFDYYVDGNAVHRYPVHDPAKGKSPRFKITRKHMAGFRIAENQAITETKLGYVIYLGETPPTKWWPRALASPEK